MQLHPAPDPQQLLPPLLACLPLAFFSEKPPPAILPLLSPILRQRVSVLSSSTEKWLSLMSWDKSRSAVLTEKVENMQLEAHPASGEIEIADPESIQYRRLDQETLHSRLDVREFELLPIYVWCDEDPTGDGPGWKLHELRTIEDIDDGTEWQSSEAEANEANPMHSDRSKITHLAANQTTTSANDADDDDSYWASYDQTPGRTPAQHTPARRQSAFAPTTTTAATNDNDGGDDSYYARYGSVQPALDPHDPDEEVPESTHQSTLNGNTVHNPTLSAPQSLTAAAGWESRSMFPADKPSSAHDSATASTSHLHEHLHLNQPRPTSPGSVVSDASVERLEQGAVDMTRAEMGVKTHIGAEVKSLFRLARSVGLDRAEFERIVRTQLDVIGMLEDEE
ncbi:hypothetical protein MBLNU457_g0833t1 [Dothideomycetes sp. NU457]